MCCGHRSKMAKWGGMTIVHCPWQVVALKCYGINSDCRRISSVGIPHIPRDDAIHRHSYGIVCDATGI